MICFEGNTADEAWLSAASAINKLSGLQPGRGGNTKELFRASFVINDPKQRWVVNRSPALNPAFALAEVIWIVNGKNDSSYLNYWNSKLPEFAGHGSTYHGAYGYRIRHGRSVDQLSKVYLTLKNNPNSRQAVLEIWDAYKDLPLDDGTPSDPDIPCNVFSLIKVRDGKLEWSQFMRSNDLLLGTPHNFVQFMTLQEVLAGWLGIEVGTYFHYSDSLHQYVKSEAEDIVVTSVSVETSTDSLMLPKNESEIFFSELYKESTRLIEKNLSKEELRSIASNNKFPPAFKNIFLILCAESARRRRMSSEIDFALDNCSNRLFVQLWSRWINRTNSF